MSAAGPACEGCGLTAAQMPAAAEWAGVDVAAGICCEVPVRRNVDTPECGRVRLSHEPGTPRTPNQEDTMPNTTTTPDTRYWGGRPDAYQEACAAATTGQGLDPLDAALDAAGIEHGIEQTGGFCMVLTVATATGVYAVTRDGADPKPYMVCEYPGTMWTEGPGDDEEYPEPSYYDLEAAVSILAAARA